MIARIVLIARNTFRAIMGRRALYIWGAAILLMFLRSAPAVFAQGDPGRVKFIRANAVSGALDVWALLCVGAAILLGASSVAGEITTRTIVTVLARPIRRWELLAGKWIGVMAFALLSLAMGLVLDVGLARYLEIEVDGRVLSIALAQTAFAIALFGGFAVALSSVGSAPLAAALTVLLAFMPGLVQALKEDPGRARRAIGRALGAATPPGYESLYRGVAWAPFPVAPNARVPARLREPPAIDYERQRRNIAENGAFAGLYFVIVCFFFSRRDMKLS